MKNWMLFKILSMTAPCVLLSRSWEGHFPEKGSDLSSKAGIGGCDPPEAVSSAIAIILHHEPCWLKMEGEVAI